MIWLIGIGGSLGAAARYLLGAFINNNYKSLTPLPLGTFLINISGSFLLGFIANYYFKGQLDDWVWFFFGIGFCGAFTTLSTFGFEVVGLLQAKNTGIALFYVITSVVLGCIAASVGLTI